MRQEDVRKQVAVAISHVESALNELTDRLERLPGSRRRTPVQRAGRTLRRTADTVAEHIPFDRASSIATETGRTLRRHPLETALTAAVAGYCVWSLIRWSNNRSNAKRLQSSGSRGRGMEGSNVEQAGIDYQPEQDQYARH